jgi:RimJ/RimL family protein N-acetyltransferase
MKYERGLFKFYLEDYEYNPSFAVEKPVFKLEEITRYDENLKRNFIEKYPIDIDDSVCDFNLETILMNDSVDFSAILTKGKKSDLIMTFGFQYDYGTRISNKEVLEFIYTVREPYRNLGFGSYLTRYFLEKIVKRKLNKKECDIIAKVDKNNLISQHVIKKSGFREYSQKNDYYIYKYNF